MGVKVAFDYALFVAQYPEFVGLSVPLADSFFVQAGFFCGNDGYNGPPVTDAAEKSVLMNLVTAHIATLRAYTINPDGTMTLTSTLVGSITSASEGSVSVGVENPANTEDSAWWQQTKYGALYWQMMAAYRTFRYIPAPGYVLARGPLGRRFLFGRGGPW